MFNVLLVSLEVRCPRWSALMPVFHRVTSQVFFSSNTIFSSLSFFLCAEVFFLGHVLGSRNMP